MRRLIRNRFPFRPLTAVFAIALFAGGASAVYRSGAVAAALTAATSYVCVTTTACVSGQNSTAGPGVNATSARGTAITASGTSGLSAKGTTGPGVQGVSTKGVGVAGISTSVSGSGVTGNGEIGVKGNSAITDGIGVWGSSTGMPGYGVYGSASGSEFAIGVKGEADAAGQTGVDGFSKNGTGVSATGGTEGLNAAGTTSFGVFGYSVDDVGIYGESVTATAIEGETLSTVYAMPSILGTNPSASGAGGEFVGQFGLIAESTSASGYPLILDNKEGTNVFYVSNQGDVYYAGSLQGFARIANGATVTEYSPKAASPTLEDTGTAQLVNGVAAVPLDPTFAASIDTTVSYRVFVTPDGDMAHGLFVAKKTPAGFVVREMQGGRSTVSFDYRVVATALGASGRRMKVTDPASEPHIPRPSLRIPPRPALRNPPHNP